MLRDMKLWARGLRREVHAICLAAHNPHVPWYAKVLAIAVAGYALSPLDLIPDFIPVLGVVDDLILVPLGIWLVRSMIPAAVMAECRVRASEAVRKPVRTSRVNMPACAIFGAALSSFRGRQSVARWQGDLGWLGRLQESLKCRLAWKLTCTPARLANKRERKLRISTEVDRMS